MRTHLSEIAGRLFSRSLSKGEWEEELHPRGEAGKFAPKGEGASPGAGEPAPVSGGKEEKPEAVPPKPSGPKESFDDYKKVTTEEKLAQANYKDISEQMGRNLDEARSHKAEHTLLEGKMTAEHASAIGDSARKEMACYTKYLSGDAAFILHERIRGFEDVLRKYSDEFKDIDAKDLQMMAIDSVQKMVHQEVESNRNAFNDHGVRHIGKNVETTNKILDVLEKQGVAVTGRDRLMGFFSQVNHDVGYTTPFVREGKDFGIAASGDHPAFSAKIMEEQRDIFNRDKVFSGEEYDRMKGIVQTHASAELDLSNPVATAVRLADNLSLFHQEKLPSFFKYVPDSQSLLTDMGDVAKEVAESKKAGDWDSKKGELTKKFEGIRDQLYGKIDETKGMSPELKRDLKAGVAKTTFMTPKFTLGVLAGEMTDIHPGKDSLIEVEIEHNPFDSFLQERFDMGQKQTKGFLETYGVKDFSKSEYRLGDYKGKGVVGIRVNRGKK